MKIFNLIEKNKKKEREVCCFIFVVSLKKLVGTIAVFVVLDGR